MMTDPTLKRGGKHPIFGIFVGGSPLDKDYKLTDAGYSSTSQLRSEKNLNVAETSLFKQRSDTTSLKFNGKMDVKEENTASLSELNLEGFLRAVEAMSSVSVSRSSVVFQMPLAI